MNYPATPRADELLAFIAGFVKQNNGASPSFDEMKNALGLKAKSGVHRMLTQLEERGAIRRLPNRARAIELVRTRTVTLPPDLHLEAHAAAKRRGTTVNALVADAVRCWLDTD